MPDNPALFVVWGVFGLLIGYVMYLFLGGNPLIHMAIGIVAGIAGGAFARANRNRD